MTIKHEAKDYIGWPRHDIKKRYILAKWWDIWVTITIPVYPSSINAWSLSPKILIHQKKFNWPIRSTLHLSEKRKLISNARNKEKSGMRIEREETGWTEKTTSWSWISRRTPNWFSMNASRKSFPLQLAKIKNKTMEMKMINKNNNMLTLLIPELSIPMSIRWSTLNSEITFGPKCNTSLMTLKRCMLISTKWNPNIGNINNKTNRTNENNW